MRATKKPAPKKTAYTVRLPGDLYEKAAEYAGVLDLSVNAFLVRAISREVILLEQDINFTGAVEKLRKIRDRHGGE